MSLYALYCWSDVVLNIKLIIILIFIFFRELLLHHNYLRVLPYELGKLFNLHSLGLHGNPLSKEIFNLYGDTNGTHKLLTYLLDSLQSECLIFLCYFTISSKITIFEYQQMFIIFYYSRVTFLFLHSKHMR